MQLYSVKFRSAKDRTIDTGEVLIVAGNKEAAEDAVMMHLDLPRSSTSCEVSRLKPSLHIISRSDVPKDNPVNGTFPRSDIELDRQLFAVQITATVWSHNGDEAAKKVAKSVLAKIKGQDDGRKPPPDLKIFADVTEAPQRRSRFEENASFTHMKMFQDGAASPR